jgi:xanthine dehydrogenase accessory factor
LEHTSVVSPIIQKAVLSRTLVLIRGGGDVASGVALRLHRAGLPVLISELPQPLAVRRTVSFSQAVYSGSIEIEGCLARRVASPADRAAVEQILAEKAIPVIVDPDGNAVSLYHPEVVVDARMRKERAEGRSDSARFLIGLGPGFVAGESCDAVVETNRGISLGRVIWKGSAEPNTCVPESVCGHGQERVLRAPVDGTVTGHARIGDHLEPGQLIAQVGGKDVTAGFRGVLRGLVWPELAVIKGMKIGDIDPRDDPRLCTQVSDKSLAVGGGVLEAICSHALVFESLSFLSL